MRERGNSLSLELKLVKPVTRLAILCSSQPTVQQLLIAKAAEDRHRINCFTEGIGVLGGWGVAAIGIHAFYGTHSRLPNLRLPNLRLPNSKAEL